MYETWYLMQAMIQTGLDISPIITHRYHYTKFEEAFEVMRSGNPGKVIIDWDEESSLRAGASADIWDSGQRSGMTRSISLHLACGY